VNGPIRFASRDRVPVLCRFRVDICVQDVRGIERDDALWLVQMYAATSRIALTGARRRVVRSDPIVLVRLMLPSYQTERDLDGFCLVQSTSECY